MNRIFGRNIVLFLVCILGNLIFESCEKSLNKDPLSQISINEAYKDEASFNEALTGIYAQFYDLASTFVTLNELRSDNFTHYQWLQEALSDNNFGGYDTDGLWDGLYNIISRVNILLDRINNIEIDNKSQYIAEARFLRAYADFWLVRSYGDVPISQVNLSNIMDALKTPRSSFTDVYKLIEDDLEFGVNNLSVSIVKGRANKYVAESELAKVYVTESGYPINNNKYDKAILLLEDIIESGVFQLEENYSDIFSLEGENGREIIWSAVMDDDPRGHQHSGQYIIDPREPDLVMACSPEFQSGQNPLLGDLWLSFEEGDVRRDVSLDSSSFDNTGAYRRQVNCHKYKYGFTQGIGWTSDYIFTRYANVLLLYAECLDRTGEQGVIGNKWDILNLIRRRAKLSNIIPSGNEDFTSFLLEERRHEFVWEGTRWFDLVRTNKFVEKLEGVGHSDVKDFWKLLPIPFKELDKMNGVWLNNPGY